MVRVGPPLSVGSAVPVCITDVSDLDFLPPFPVLIDEPVDAWAWPAPPYDWRHVPPPGNDVAQPCRLETPSGAAVEGFMLHMDTAAGSLAFRTGPDGEALALPFSRFRSLTLTTPLKSDHHAPGRRPERVPLAAQERDYRLSMGDASGARHGRTAGRVESAEGLYLFMPGDDGYSLSRVFVPRWAYTRCVFGPTVLDLAAEKWISGPRELLAAIARQRSLAVQPIGQSLLDLGFVTQAQLDRALTEPLGEMPLGERLVALGVISKADLQTAIAHKMGYPLVDLTRFPIDLAVARKLPLRMAVRHRALPLMVDGQRLIVAVDRPSRAAELQALYAVAPFSVVAVLASKSQILLALSSLSDQDVWTESVTIRAQFFATSR